MEAPVEKGATAQVHFLSTFRVSVVAVSSYVLLLVEYLWR